jgi:hypothetical protein
MTNEELATVLQRLIGMVSSAELATTSVLEILVQNAVIDRDVLLKGLIEHRDKLDPKYSKGSFDMMIETLTPKAADGLH